MKKIYENIPVQSLLYHIGGLVKITIIDYDNTQYKTNPHIKYSGLLKDMNTSKEYPTCTCDRVMKAAVHGVDIIGKDNIEISISTKYEEF